MPLAKIKTEEERARLDAIFAELEAAERGDTPEPVDTRTQEQLDEDTAAQESIDSQTSRLGSSSGT